MSYKYHRVFLETKRRLHKRAKNKCEECSSAKDLHIHHKIAKQKGINNSLDNLQLLCRKCHIKKGKSMRTNKNRKIIFINVAFEDKEIKKLEDTKGDMSWHDFILKLIEKEEKK